VYGETPPEAENVVELLTAKVTEEGEIAKAALIVTVASAVAPTLSVTRIVALPELAGAV
jgi:hypothetical protein